ncbi:hypothetical protein KKE03_04400 [Patescibacteria group bacterium]|nr:hypothetical protein [Patescibacteria group bacterium]
MPVEVLSQPLTPINRISPTVESQNREFTPLALTPDLKINPHLKEAGIDLGMEVRRLIRGVNSALEAGRTLNEAASLSAAELEINLRSYDTEIIKSRPVLPHMNRFGYKNDRLRMVGNSGEPIVDAITAQERNGAVLEASRTIESFLVSAGNNSFAVLMNPAGWNGFVDEYGQNAEPHLNVETMVFWKDKNGALKGLTLVTDLKEEQAKQTMVSLGVEEEAMDGQNERERLANIVRNPALLSLPAAYANPFEYVLDKILIQRGQEDLKLRMRDGTVEIRSIEEVEKDINRFEELLNLTQEEEKLVTDPKRYILENIEKLGDKSVQQEIINRMEKAILMLTRVYRRTKEQITAYPTNMETYPTMENRRRIEDDFSAEIMFLKTRAGCPASTVTRILGGSSLGLSRNKGVDNRDPDYCNTCPVCGVEIRCVVRNGQCCPNCKTIKRCG